MTTNDRILAVNLADTSPEIADQLVQGFVLGFCGQIAIEIADEADADGNIVQIVAMNMASVELANPAISDFDLTVSRRRAISDHEMVSQSIWHFADMPMVVVKDARITLARTAVMNDNVLPAIARHARVIDSPSNCRC